MLVITMGPPNVGNQDRTHLILNCRAHLMLAISRSTPNVSNHVGTNQMFVITIGAT